MRYETFECDICHSKNSHPYNGDQNNIMLQAYYDDSWDDEKDYECCSDCYDYVKKMINERIETFAVKR